MIDFCGLMWACVCSTIVEWSVQTAWTPFNIFENKGKVQSMLNESLNRFKFDSTRFQQAFNTFLRFQQYWTSCSNAPDIWFNKVLNACWSKCWNRFNGPLKMSVPSARSFSRHKHQNNWHWKAKEESTLLVKVRQVHDIYQINVN